MGNAYLPLAALAVIGVLGVPLAIASRAGRGSRDRPTRSGLIVRPEGPHRRGV
jgi:hypothetical protein